MKRNFLMFFLGAIAMGAVLALVSSASNYSPNENSNNTRNSEFTKITASESYEVSNPVVVQSEYQFVQPDVQNWEIGNNLEITKDDTHKPDAISWEINEDLELTRIDKGKSSVRSYTLAGSEFIRE